MSEHDVNRLESKLDQILTILHGDGSGDMGLVQKVNLMWRLFMVWPVCTASAAVGVLLTLLIQKLF